MILVILLMVLAVLLIGAITGALVWMVSSRPGALQDQTLSAPTGSAAHVPFPAYTAPSAEGPGSAPLAPYAIDGIVFDTAMRGYSMRQVDEALDRLRDELNRRDREIADLRSQLDAARTAPTGDPQLGHGPVVRPTDGSSLWSGGVRSFQIDRPEAGAVPPAQGPDSRASDHQTPPDTAL